MVKKSTPARALAQAKPATRAHVPRPEKFAYALKGYTAECRAKGWYVSATTMGDANREWCGPFATIESACLAIGRRLAVEIADRHTRSIEFHHILRDDPLYGLKPTTRIDSR